MTAPIRQRAEMRVHNFRRRVARESLIDSAVNVANLETARSFEPYPEPVNIAPPRWQRITFRCGLIALVLIGALIVWLTHGSTLPPDFVRAFS